MKQKILGVSADPHRAGVYLRYSDERSKGSFDLVRDPDGVVREYGNDDPEDKDLGVVVDLDTYDQIVGIAIADIDDPLEVQLAREYAADNDLDFPDDVRAAARITAT